jgi:hypothetical protein
MVLRTHSKAQVCLSLYGTTKVVPLEFVHSERVNRSKIAECLIFSGSRGPDALYQGPTNSRALIQNPNSVSKGCKNTLRFVFEM